MKIQIEAYKQKFNIRHIILVITVVLIFAGVGFIAVFLKSEKSVDEKSAANNSNEENTIKEEQKQYIPTMTEVGLENIKHIYSSEKKIVYLTFDDGPSNDVTNLILDILNENNIKATFFVLGTQVEKYPDVLKREYNEGHYIGNHGYSHLYKKIYEFPDAVLDEYNKTDKAIAKALNIEGYKTYLFRFPGGSVGGPYNNIKKVAAQKLNKENIAYLDWNALTRDSEGRFTKEQLLHNLQLTIRDQNSLVILFHDASGKILTYEVLPDIIKYLKESGYEFGDMRDLIK